MPNDPPTCYQMLHKFEECSDQHPKLSVLPNTVYVRFVTLLQWRILLAMIFATYPTLQQFSTTTLIFFLSKLRSMSLLCCTEILVRSHIFFLTYILRSFPLWRSFSFSLFIAFPVSLRFSLMLRLVITLLQLPNEFLQCLGLIILNVILKH